MKRNYEAYLLDILEAIARIQEYTKGFTKSDFKASKITTDAVLRNLEIIGEAVAQLPDDLKKEHPEVPWRDIKDFRNVVAHHYFALNVERIWDIIQHKLGPLQKDINAILKGK